ncbi:MAG: hypothetical protein U7127_02090 [Phormidium sp.]
MFVLLPIIAFVLLFLNIYSRQKKCWRSSFLLSSLVWAVLLTATTEVLSLFKLLTFGWVMSAWLLICTLLGFFYKLTFPKRKPVNQRRKLVKDLQIFLKQDGILTNSQTRTWLLGILFIVSMIGLIAIIAPPNTNDSMGYHMPRVMHWIQNHTVNHFPTNYTAQLFLSPWSAFGILHFQILSGSDRFVNLVQWFSMIGSIMGISLIAKQLGANLYGQVFAAVFCATIPMGILQGSSTQNDYVVSFWLICLIHYILLSLEDKTGNNYVVQIGLSLALATFAKPTAYLYSFPFFVWLFLVKVKVLRWQIYKPAVQVAMLLFVVNGFHWMRNFKVFRNPLGTSPEYIVYTNKEFSIPILLSNIIRNLALHISTPSAGINSSIINVLSSIHSFLGVDINDPRTSSSNFQLNSLINHEDLAANTAHLLLIFVAIACAAIAWRKKAIDSSAINYILCIIGGFLLFCSLLAWTPFHTRLHLPMFVLSSAFVGCVLAKQLSMKLVNLVVTFLLISSLFWVFFSETRPVIANSNFIKTGKLENLFTKSRTELYFMGRRNYKVPMIGAADFIKSQQCSDIGITFDKLDIYEYPIWALLKTHVDKNYRIQHFGINNVSQVKQEYEQFKNFNPCIILDASGKILEKMPEQKNNYTQKWFLSPVSVLIKTND